MYVAALDTEAHPRVSGENSHARDDETMELGSSPRERGKRIVVPTSMGKIGLIPA